MEIQYKRGSVLDAEEYWILHQVNCQGVMGSGVAKAIRDKWPKVFEEYHQFYRMQCGDHIFSTTSDTLGQIVTVKVEDHEIINLFGQKHFGTDGRRYTSYDAFYDGLIATRNYIEADWPFDQKKELAVPYKIGSDRGGADWTVIEAMFFSVFGNTNIKITFYEYHP